MTCEQVKRHLKNENTQFLPWVHWEPYRFDWQRSHAKPLNPRCIHTQYDSCSSKSSSDSQPPPVTSLYIPMHGIWARALPRVLTSYDFNRPKDLSLVNNRKKLLQLQYQIVDHCYRSRLLLNKKKVYAHNCVLCALAFQTSSSAVAEKPRCRVGQFWPKC